MRKIEQNMLYAIRNKKYWRLDNTEVVYYDRQNISCVRLHGHNIYSYDHQSDEQTFSLCGWNTPTTRSRLQALGVRISTRLSTPYFLKDDDAMCIENIKNGRAIPISATATYSLLDGELKEI